MNYTFNFEWGEIWTVTEEDFNWDVEYWCKVLARQILHYRNVSKSDKLITTVMIFSSDEYVGVVSGSDNFVNVILHGRPEYCWRVDEL